MIYSYLRMRSRRFWEAFLAEVLFFQNLATGAMIPSGYLLTPKNRSKIRRNDTMNRNILVSMVIIGLVAGTVGVSTTAYFNDTETSSDNTFTTGGLDLKVGWDQTYNGEERNSQNLTDDPGPIFNLEDVKPGDKGEATVNLQIYDNPGHIWMRVKETADEEVKITEPERDLGDTDPDGELDDELKFKIWKDDGDNVKEAEEETIFEGTAREMAESDLGDGKYIDTSTNSHIGVKWWLPKDVGNRVQKDRVGYDFDFYTEQKRHNGNPSNPFTGEDDDSGEDDSGSAPEVDNGKIDLEPICLNDKNKAKFRISNQNDVEVHVGYNADHISKEKIKIDANSETLIHVPADGDITVKLLRNGEEIDSEQSISESCESDEPEQCEEPEDDEKEFSADEIAQAKYDHDFEDLSDETQCEVSELFENQPFREDLDPEDVRTRDEISQDKWDVAYDELSDESRNEVDQIYSDQFQGDEEPEGTEYTVVQGDTEIDVEAFEGNVSVEDLYDLRIPSQYTGDNGASDPGSGPYYESAGTQDLQAPETSIMFLYEGPEGLSLVVVHDKAGGDGGSATWTLENISSGEWTVKDDLYLNPNTGEPASSNYDRWNVSSSPHVIDWTWGGGGTDGGVYTFQDDEIGFTIDPAFNQQAELWQQYYNGTIDDWQVLSGDRASPNRTSLDLDQSVTVQSN
jgi:predicted ribosomally synthesized peptide with SipW-like signal peptide